MDAWFSGFTFAGGDTNTISNTTDGGSTFKTFIILPKSRPNLFVDTVSFLNASQGWAVVDDPTKRVRSYDVIGTSDGGAAWHVIASNQDS